MEELVKERDTLQTEFIDRKDVREEYFLHSDESKVGPYERELYFNPRFMSKRLAL